MFRNDNEFDEVAAYRKEQGRSNKNDRFDQDNRFDKRDDFKYDEDFSKEETSYQDSEHKPTPEVKQPKLPNKPQKNSKAKSIIITAITFLAISGIFGNVVRGCNNIFFNEDSINEETTTNEVAESDLVDGDIPVMKTKSMNTSEFIKEYKKAKDNQINFDRISRNYVSGNYGKSFFAIEKYLRSEYQDDYKTRFLCVSELNEDDYEYQSLACARDVDQFEDLKYPSDFVEAANKESISLYDYQIYNSDSNIVYFINGRVYTQELIDLIVKWHETGKFS